MLGRIYFISDYSCQNFLVFAPMLRSLTLDNNKKLESPRKNKPFDTGLEPTMSNLANGRVILKFKSSVLVQEILLNCIVTSF